MWMPSAGQYGQTDSSYNTLNDSPTEERRRKGEDNDDEKPRKKALRKIREEPYVPDARARFIQRTTPSFDNAITQILMNNPNALNMLGQRPMQELPFYMGDVYKGLQSGQNNPQIQSAMHPSIISNVIQMLRGNQ